MKTQMPSRIWMDWIIHTFSVGVEYKISKRYTIYHSIYLNLWNNIIVEVEKGLVFSGVRYEEQRMDLGNGRLSGVCTKLPIWENCTELHTPPHPHTHTSTDEYMHYLWGTINSIMHIEIRLGLNYLIKFYNKWKH